MFDFWGVFLSTTIRVGSRILDIPTSGQSPNWAASITESLQALSEALTGVLGPFDVPPQSISIDTDVTLATDVPLLSFPPSDVRSFVIKYAVLRVSDTTTESESGEIQAVYIPDQGIWLVSREATGTPTSLTLSVTNQGQVQYSTSSVGGNYQSGSLQYQATAIIKAD